MRERPSSDRPTVQNCQTAVPVGDVPVAGMAPATDPVPERGEAPDGVFGRSEQHRSTSLLAKPRHSRLGLGIGVVAVTAAFFAGSCANRGFDRAASLMDPTSPALESPAAEAPTMRTKGPVAIVRPTSGAAKTARLAAPVAVSKNVDGRIDTAFEEGGNAMVPRGKPGPSAETRRFMTAAVTHPAPEPRRMAPPPTLDLPVAKGPLGHFAAKLAALKSGRRTEPVTILHIGDSHIAADSFTRGIRKRLQQRFGDAGRGDVIPPDVFKYAYADQVSMSRSGSWRAATSLKTKSGPFGISGVRLSSASTSAKLVMKTKTGPFDYGEVTIVTGPKAGGVVIEAGGRRERFSARAPREGARTVRLDARASSLVVRPAGDGTTTVLYWGTGKNRPGIRYVNFGISGATVDVTRRWNDAIVADNIRDLKPDLIVYGYGTNEGFNDNVDLAGYRRYVSGFLDHLAAAAPDADMVFIGASDGLTRRSRRGDACTGGYRSPPKLDGIRQTVHAIARARGAAWWDWSEAMGGRCSIDRWARSRLAARDRVHMTSAGYDKSAGLFVEALLTKAGRPAQVASRN